MIGITYKNHFPQTSCRATATATRNLNSLLWLSQINIIIIVLITTTTSFKFTHSFPSSSSSLLLRVPSFHTVLKNPSTTTTTTTTTQLFAGAKSGTKKKKPKDNTITVNRLARRNYEIINTFEAGVSLLGSEVKAIRDGRMNLRDGYIRPSKNGRSCTLINVHIGKYEGAGEYFNHEERRPRPLLLRKEESRKLMKEVEMKGMTVIPLKAYFNDSNKVKIQIGLCRGKNVRDKRDAIQERQLKRESDRMMKNFRIN